MPPRSVIDGLGFIAKPGNQIKMDDLAQRLAANGFDRVPTVREVAQLGAVLGREFAYEVIKALTTIEESALQERLAQLVNAELLYQRGRPPRAWFFF